MAVVKPSDCLFNCLKEVRLEKFHRNFIERGLTNCDQLGCLPMDQYSQFGVVSMEDRKRLFSIIGIIKSVKADGILCQHGITQLERKPEHGVVRKHEELTTVIASENFKPVAKNNNLDFAPKKLAYCEHDNKQDQGKAHVKPVNNYKVAVERSAEEDLKQKQLLKHGVVSRKSSDSPMFQCKKMLNFSDPDLYSDEEPHPALNVNTRQDAQPAVKVAYFSSSQVNKKEAPPSNCGYKTSAKESIAASGVVNEPFQRGCSVAKECMNMKGDSIKRTSDYLKNSKAAVHAATGIAWKKAEAADDILTSRSTGAQAATDGEKTTSDNKAGSDVISSKCNVNANSTASNVSSATAFASTLRFNSKPNAPPHSLKVITKELITGPKNFIFDFKPIQSDEYEKTTRNFWQHPSKNNSNRNHAYFPAPEPVGPALKPMHIEQIIHSGGYDYGVPDGSGKSQSSAPQTDNDNRSVAGILYPDKIRVCVRKRPRNAKELKRKDQDIIRIRGQQTVVVEELKVAIDLTKYIHQHVLKFDDVFSDKCTNQEVYERAVKPLITCVFDKGSAICFAFGQTGAGKTHTLMGSKGVPGMYQLAGEDLFALAHSGKNREPLRLWVSFYEIYCGHLYDLLNKRKRLHVRENGKQKVCVAGLMENPVPDIASLIKVINYGNSFRSHGSTGVNPHSSRSHALLQMDVRDSHDNKVGRLTFIDLAGSERASDATNLNRQTRIEGAEINQSLLALKECIRSIDQESGHTPYRQSKLTHILRDSFLGNSQTVMIANISPTQTACENTLNTLRYADRVQELRKEVAVRSQRSTSPVFTETHSNPIPSNSRSPASKRRAPSLFHPSDIQCSSTPLKSSTARVAPPVDLSDILHNGAESPLSGHKVSGRKSSSESKDRLSPIAISPIGELHHGNDSNENRFTAAATDDVCHIPVASNTRHGSVVSGSSEDKEHSGESNKPLNHEAEVALPCTCKSEEEFLGSTDLGDELLREHRKIKTHAEMVISKVKSVIEQASVPRLSGSNGLSNHASDPAHVLFLETKTCMENARENIRDFLDNEKKNRMALEPGSILQRESSQVITTSVGQFDFKTSRLDSNFRYLDEIIPDETAQRCQEEANTACDKNTEQRKNSNSQVRNGDIGSSNQSFGSSDCVSASICNPSREPRSWAAILQDSGDPANTVGNDAFSSQEQLPDSQRNLSEQESDCRKGRLSRGSCHSGEEPVDGDDDIHNDEEPVDGEEVPSFVISKEVRLLQLKIQELKQRKSRLEREQRLFFENQQSDCERFKETFPMSSGDAKVSAAAVFSFRQHLSPSKGSFLTPEGDVYKEALTRVDLKIGDKRVDEEISDARNGQIFPDLNGNFSKFSCQDLSTTVEEKCKIVRRLSDGFECNRIRNLESGDCTEEVERIGDGWASHREIGDNTHNGIDRTRSSDNQGTYSQNQFCSGVQDYGLSTDDVRLKFAAELECEIDKSSLRSAQQELGNVEIPQAHERNSRHDGEFLMAEGTTDEHGTFTLHRNSAFTKVMPSTNKSSNNSQQSDIKPPQSTDIHSKQEPVEILTSASHCLSLPGDSFVATGFEPIEVFPVTSRAELETNEPKKTKDWNVEDGSSVDKSNSALLQEAAALERTRSLLVTAHEDQLTAVTHLCKQEMSLLMAVRTGQMGYDKYMESIRDILCTKSKIILALMEHINEFHTASSNS